MGKNNDAAAAGKPFADKNSLERFPESILFAHIFVNL
jgi:hypothetical protein